MNYDLSITTPRVADVVSLADAKLHLRVETSMTDDDDLITALIAAATDHCEMYTRRTIRTTVYKMIFDCFPWDSFFYLPRSPLISLDSINYYDIDGNLSVLSTDVYEVGSGISSPARVVLKPNQIWPDTQDEKIEAVIVNFTAGDATSQPAFVAAIKLLVGHWYENREAVIVGGSPVVLPMSVKMLLDGVRILEISN